MRKAILIIAAVSILGIAGLGKETDSTKVALSSNSKSSATTSSSSSSARVSPGVTPTTSSAYKDGTFTGAVADTPYGTVQIAVQISSGKIINVDFLQMPSDMGHSQEITAAAEPLLKQTTLQAQSSNIDFVSGATSTSFGYEQSLQAALDQAKIG